MNTHYDVVIIGAGVAGASAAILLAQAGWSVGIVEKHRFPRRKVCGECIAASNLPLLDALGIGAAFDSLAGAPLRRVGMYAGDNMITSELPAYAHPVHRWGRALAREHLDTLLLQRAVDCGASVWQPWTLRALKRTGDTHECALKALDSGHEATLNATLLIDAHGAWEPLPIVDEAGRATTGRKPLQGSDMFAFKGNFKGADLASDLLPVLAFTGGYGGMVQAADGELTVACCIRRDALQAIRLEATGERAAQAVQRHLQSHCLGVRQALRGARQHGAWLSVGPIRPGIREAADGAGRFAIGNAAGEAHPILGEGISMAIQSAWLLCSILRSAPNARAIAANNVRMAAIYRLAWQRSFSGRIRTAAVFSQLAMRPTATRALLPVLRLWPHLLGLGARFGGKVSCTVRADAWQPATRLGSKAISTVTEQP